MQSSHFREEPYFYNNAVIENYWNNINGAVASQNVNAFHINNYWEPRNYELAYGNPIGTPGIASTNIVQEEINMRNTMFDLYASINQPRNYELAYGNPIVGTPDIAPTNIAQEEINMRNDEDLIEQILYQYKLAQFKECRYFEDDRIPIKWPSQWSCKGIDICNNSIQQTESDKDRIVLKDARVVLERISTFEINQHVKCSTSHVKLTNFEAPASQHIIYSDEENSLYSCTICPYKSDIERNFKRHMKSHKMFNNLIKKCESDYSANGVESNSDDNDIQSFSKKYCLINQYRFLNNFIRFCSQCDKTFENNTIIDLNYCHLCKNQLLMQCITCNSTHKNIEDIRRHLFRKCALRVYHTCPECNYQNVRKDYVKEHIKRRHTWINHEELNWCFKCGKGFGLLQYFNKHVRACRIDPNLYFCDQCSFSTNRKSDISLHVHTHMKADGSEKMKI